MSLFCNSRTGISYPRYSWGGSLDPWQGDRNQPIVLASEYGLLGTGSAELWRMGQIPSTGGEEADGRSWREEPRSGYEEKGSGSGAVGGKGTAYDSAREDPDQQMAGKKNTTHPALRR